MDPPIHNRGSTASSIGRHNSTVSSYASFKTAESHPQHEKTAPSPAPPLKKKKFQPPQLDKSNINYNNNNNNYNFHQHHYHHHHHHHDHRPVKPMSPKWQSPPDRLAELLNESAEAERFARLILAMLVSLIISLSMASLVLWILFGVDLPIFEVGALTVSNLTVTRSVIIATKWTVNVTVTNPNSEFKLSDDLLNATILYDNYPLATSSILPVYRQVKNDDSDDELIQQANLYLEFDDVAMATSHSGYLPESVVGEVTRSLDTGVLPVSLSVVVGSKFVVTDEQNSGRRRWSHDTLKIYCGDLKILISGNERNGYLAKESIGKQCLTFA